MNKIMVFPIGLALLLTACSAPESDNSAPGQSAESSASEPAKAPEPADDPLSDGGWTVSDIQTVNGDFGPSITARVTNTEKDTRSGVFTLTVFSGEQRIEQAMGSVNDLEAGQAATVTFIGSTMENLPGDPAMFTYDFQSDL